MSVNEELAEELHKPVITSSKKGESYVRFKGNISAANLAEMGSLSSKNVKYVKYFKCYVR